MASQSTDRAQRLVENGLVSASVDSPAAAGCQSVRKAIQCEVCADSSATVEATGACVDCMYRPLCQAHIDAHRKTRQFAKHVISEINDQIASMVLASRCLVHPGKTISMFCQPCNRCICQACVQSADHRGHKTESLAAAAKKIRRNLAKTIQSTSVYTKTSLEAEPAPGAPAEILKRLATIYQSMEDIQHEASQATRIINDTFNEIERLAGQARERHLANVDVAIWRRLEQLQTRRRKLEFAAEYHMTVSDIRKRLLQPTSGDLMVLKVSGLVIGDGASHQEKATAENCDSAAASTNPPQDDECVDEAVALTPAVQLGSFDELKQIMPDAVKIYCAPRLDPGNFVAKLPEYADIGCDLVINVKLYDVENHPVPLDVPVPEVKVSVSLPPTGGRQELEAVADNCTTHGLKVVFVPMESGLHTFHFEAERKRRSITIKVGQEVRFDTTKSNGNLDFTKSNHRAENAFQAPFGEDNTLLALAGRGYDTGRHMWNVRVDRSKEMKEDGFGVTVLPAVPSQAHGKDIPVFCYWNVQGEVHVRDRTALSKETAFRKAHKEGDTLTLTLDCSANTLTCHNRRTGMKREAPIPCTEPLHPCVWLTHKCQMEIS